MRAVPLIDLLEINVMSERRGTAWAPVNIALAKHWGYRDVKLGLPARESLSLTLEHGAKTTVIWDAALQLDEIEVNGRILSPEDGEKEAAAYRLLHSIRATAGLMGHGARVVSESTVPVGGGMASSAAGAAALTLAALDAAGLADQIDESSLISWLGRARSASAIRSLRGGVVALTTQGQAMSLATVETPLELTVLSCLVEKKPKLVSSSEGHHRARSSPFFQVFEQHSAGLIAEMIEALEEGDLDVLGALVEQDALAMHGVMLTGRPPTIYTTDATWAVWGLVARWREEGLKAYCTLDAGPNPHIICEASQALEIKERLDALQVVLKVWQSGVSSWGAHVIKQSPHQRVVM